MDVFWTIFDWLGWFDQREIKLVGLEMTADKWLMHQQEINDQCFTF